MSSQLTRKDISRRDFLRLSAAAAGAAVFVGPASALPAFAESGAADEAAINALPATLFDASRCTGCRSCEEACVATHNLNPTAEDDGKLTANRYTYIAEVPLESRPRWVQKQCMHCLEPACVAACPSRALDWGPIEDLRSKYGTEAGIAPLPDPSITKPHLVIHPHRDAQPWNSATGHIANPGEI